jgi:hypothetical protein
MAKARGFTRVLITYCIFAISYAVSHADNYTFAKCVRSAKKGLPRAFKECDSELGKS